MSNDNKAFLDLARNELDIAENVTNELLRNVPPETKKRIMIAFGISRSLLEQDLESFTKKLETYQEEIDERKTNFLKNQPESKEDQ